MKSCINCFDRFAVDWLSIQASDLAGGLDN